MTKRTRRLLLLTVTTRDVKPVESFTLNPRRQRIWEFPAAG